MKISSDINVWDAGMQYNELGATTIQNWMTEETAERFLEEIKKIPEEWWFQSTYDGKEVKNIQYLPQNTEQLAQNSEQAQKAFLQGKFSYNFDRSMPHVAGCNCVECRFKEWLAGPEVLGWISRLTGENLTGTGELFASRYKAGQFLSPHHDKNKGTIGFVFNITKNWKPEFGGSLHMLEEDYVNINKVVLPKFNQLTIFNIPKVHGVPHFVSHVVEGVTNERLSFTGWFS